MKNPGKSPFLAKFTIKIPVFTKILVVIGRAEKSVFAPDGFPAYNQKDRKEILLDLHTGKM